MSAPLQTTLSPAGPQAARIHALDRTYLVVVTAVFVLVVAAMAWALLRRRRPAEAPIVCDPTGERPLARTIAVATGLTVAILFGLLVASVATGRALNFGSPSDALVVTVRGHQFWWEIQYQDPLPSNLVVDANELHLPVGRPIKLELASVDVIHSLWIPNLHGKTDLIPGHANVTVLQVDQPGEYRAQCAEFCGYEHAKMAMIVIAHPAAEFDAWLAARRAPPPPPPTDPTLARGQDVFLRASCPMCHTVRGTSASATIGPDLSFVGARKTIGAGALDNGPGALAGWIVDPQGIKPGVHMPANPLPGEDLQALIAWLGSLR